MILQRSHNDEVRDGSESGWANGEESSPVAWIALKSPILKFFLPSEPSRYKEIIILDDAEQASPGLSPASSSQEAITSAVVLFTWADFLRMRPEDAVNLLLDRMIGDSTLRDVNNVVVYLVPYASFVGPDTHAVQFVRSRDDSSSETLSTTADYEYLLQRIQDAGYRCRVFVSPMVLGDDASAETGYPSFLQKLIRVSRCVRDEVVTKVPTYFSEYAFHLNMPAGMVFNAADSRDVVDSMLADCADTMRAEDASVVLVESLVPVQSVSAELVSAIRVRLESEESCSHNSLDKFLNELLWSDQICSFSSFSCDVSGAAVRTLSSSRLHERLRQVSSHECEAWESAFAPTRDRDISKVAGLFQKELPPSVVTGRSSSQFYFEGGAGETILMLTPISIEPGYFTALVEELLPDHRIVVWQTIRQGFAEQSTAIRDVLTEEGIDRYHLFTWCSSSLLAAVLIEQDPVRVQSLFMVAPAFGISDQPVSEASKKLIWLVKQVQKHPSRAERIKLWSTQGFKQLAGQGVAEYASGTEVVSSPMQHHPVAFWNGPTRDAERTLSVIDGWLDLAKQTEGTGSTMRFQPKIPTFEGSTLALLGTHDHLTLYSAISVKCREQNWPIATFLGGNHYFILEHAPEVARLLRSFVQEKGLPHATVETVRAGRFRIEKNGSCADGARPNSTAKNEDAHKANGSRFPEPTGWSSIS